MQMLTESKGKTSREYLFQRVVKKLTFLGVFFSERLRRQNCVERRPKCQVLPSLKKVIRCSKSFKTGEKYTHTVAKNVRKNYHNFSFSTFFLSV